MHLWQDAAVAVLAAVGLVSLLRALFGRLILRSAPMPPQQFPVLLPAREDGERLQQTIRELDRIRRERGLLGPILLVDCGLTEEGRRRCALLETQQAQVILCAKDRIDTFFD